MLAGTFDVPLTLAVVPAVAGEPLAGRLANEPDGVRVVAGANPPDRAADGWEISPPLANRFCHVDYAPSVDEWLDGMQTGWAAPPASRAVALDPARRAAMVGAVTGFIRTRPDLLHVFPDRADATGGAYSIGTGSRAPCSLSGSRPPSAASSARAPIRYEAWKAR